VSPYSLTSATAAGLTINLDVPFKTTITVTYLMNPTSDNPVGEQSHLYLPIVVCGDETITIPSVLATIVEIESPGTTKVIPTATYKSIFVLDTTPSDALCKFTSFTIHSDATCSTALANPKIVLDTLNPDAEGFYPINIDTSVGFALTTFYLKAETNGLVQDCTLIKVEVCGHETITVLGPTQTARYLR
jgi:hypothetical protein